MKTNEKFEKLTKFIKSRNFIIAASVFVLTILSIGMSYASFFTVKTNTNNQKVTTGTLAVSYGNDSSSVLKTGMDIMSDEAGLNQNESSVIYIQNTGTLNSTYTLTIGYDMENFTAHSGYSENDKLTPLDYIKIAVYEYNGVNNETLIIGPITIADLPIYSQNSSDSRYNRYALLFNTLGSNTSGNSTKTYKVKMWLSDKAIEAASYTYFYVNTEIVAEVENAKMSYNLQGSLKDSSGNTLENSTISLQNGSKMISVTSRGFTIEGLYPGVYNIDIYSDGEVYSGNLTIEEGNAVSLISLGSSFTGENIYTAASTYGTTLSKILKKNGITTYADATTLNASTNYNLAPTYKLIGGSSSEISEIKIVLDTTNNSYTMSF